MIPAPPKSSDTGFKRIARKASLYNNNIETITKAAPATIS